MQATSYSAKDLTPSRILEARSRDNMVSSINHARSGTCETFDWNFKVPHASFRRQKCTLECCMPGICAGDQCLSHAAQPMHDSRTLSECGITHGSTIHVNGRLRGGTAGWQLIVKPRIQKDKWSNYWKVSCAIVHTSAWVLYLSSCRPPTTTRSILWDSLWPLLWPLQCEPMVFNSTCTGVHGDED